MLLNLYLAECLPHKNRLCLCKCIDFNCGIFVLPPIRVWSCLYLVQVLLRQIYAFSDQVCHVLVVPLDLCVHQSLVLNILKLSMPDHDFPFAFRVHSLVRYQNDILCNPQWHSSFVSLHSAFCLVETVFARDNSKLADRFADFIGSYYTYSVLRFLLKEKSSLLAILITIKLMVSYRYYYSTDN